MNYRRCAWRLIVGYWLCFAAGYAPAENLIPNSSFECGAGFGWVQWNTSDNSFQGNTRFLTGMLTNDVSAPHGGNAMTVTYSRLQGQGLWNTNGNYTFSFYAKAPLGAATLYFGMVNGASLYGGIPETNATIATSWTRYSYTYTNTANRQQWPKFYTINPYFVIDGVQLEPGTSVTAYAPKTTVECAISVPNTNNLWFSGDSPVFRLNYWNEGLAVSQLTRYDVYDLFNSNIFHRVVSVTLAAGSNTTYDVALPPGRTGWLRVVSALGTVSESRDEATLVVYPYTSNATLTVNGWLGGHPPVSPFHSWREKYALRGDARTLSPDYQNTRMDYAWPGPTTNSAITTTDSGFTNWFAAGLHPLGMLTPTDGVWPTWATNADGSANLNAWRDFCYTIVNRYKAYCTNWEVGPNEPLQSGPYGVGPSPDSANGLDYTGTNLPINVRVATNYAKCLTYGVWGITNADPTARIIGMAGAYGAGEWAYQVWTNLSAGTKAAIYAVSTHIFPGDNFEDPNTGFYEFVHYSNAQGWANTFRGIRPVWCTETETYRLSGARKGWNELFPIAYNLLTPPSVEAARSEAMNRQGASTIRILTQTLRCIGWGFEKVFHYISTPFNDDSFNGSLPFSAGAEQVDQPDSVSLSVAAYLIAGGLGCITNVNTGQFMEAYSCTNASGVPVIPIWSAERTNSLFTFTNSSFTVYDCMGNQTASGSSTLVVTRFPQYLVFSTLTQAQASNTVKHATAAASPDTTAPAISFDIAPTGTWSGATNAVLIKWTALDNVSTAWLSNWTSTNVLYKFKLDTASYPAYSQSNHIWLTNLSSGNHTCYVTAIDAAGNSAEESYAFVPTTSPIFTTATNRMRVTGTLTVRQ